MTAPIISLYGTAKHISIWMETYNSLLFNDVPFEVVFAGPVEPNFDLPGNLKFIKTNVKPAQCSEIALRNTKGKFIVHTADDIIYSKK